MICFVYIIFVTTSLLEEISFLRFKKREKLTFVSGATSPTLHLQNLSQKPPSGPWELPVNMPQLFSGQRAGISRLFQGHCFLYWLAQP